MNEKMNVLLLSSVPEERMMLEEALKEMKYLVIKAITGQEARLKLSNQNFDFIVLDIKANGLSALEFIESLRNKEKTKSLKKVVPILVLADDDNKLHDFSAIDNVQLLTREFNKDDFKKKVLTFNKKTSLNPENLKKIQKDDYLIVEGATNNEMYWILSGEFLITKLNKEDKNIIIGKASAGELIGEMSFLDSLPRSASVKALKDSEVLVIPQKKFIATLDGQPRWFRSLLHTLSMRLRNADQQIANKFVKEDDD